MLVQNGTDLGPFFAQEADNIGVSCSSSQAQGRHAAVSCSFHRCPHFKQQTHHLHMAEVGVYRQNRGVANDLRTPGGASTT